MKKRTLPQLFDPSQGRSGATLTEVLMALLVLGVGVSSLAVMFPLAILRSIEATKLTAATLHRYNVEELIDSFPELPIDPDGINGAAEHQNTNYIVDPLGDVTLRTLPGDTPDNPTGPAVPFAGLLPRFSGSIGGNPIAPLQAKKIAMLQDSWNNLFEDGDPLVTPIDLVSITIPGAFAATGLTADYDATTPNNPLVYRVMLFDITGKVSHARTVQTITAATDVVTWVGDLPASFVPVTAWLQVQEEHFSWLLTVRRQPTTADNSVPPINNEIAAIDVVVFFKREITNAEPLSTATTPVELLQESAYELIEPGFRIGIAEITLDWGTEPEPFFKVGSFVFDPHNAYWYRIVEINEDPNIKTRVTLKLDRGADAASPPDTDGDGLTGAGVFLKGIVDVYPIKNKKAVSF